MVLASYVHGYVTNPDIRWDIWGGIPSSLRPVYTVSMLGATAGFFLFTTPPVHSLSLIVSTGMHEG